MNLPQAVTVTAGHRVDQVVVARGGVRGVVARVGQARDVRAGAVADEQLAVDALGQAANAWSIVPNGTEGYAKAEVAAGGVDTRELNQQSMESRLVPGLHFIGEVVDVTGWLGGYNFQWAWASAMACARSLQASPVTV